MYQVTKKFIRPDQSVEFPNLQTKIDPAHREHFINNYVLTGKHVFRQSEYDDTELQLTTTIIWESAQAWQEFSDDPVMQELLANNSALLQSLGITEEIVSLTEF
jgi:hypothetical protein